MWKQIPSALSGIFVALPTPYRPDGTPDVERLHGILDFHLGRNVSGFCLGGVTGEYATSSVEERLALFQNVRRYLDGRAALIVGVGGEHCGQVRRLAHHAAEGGAIAALLPPPSFFQHDSGDLLEFLQNVAAELPLPVLFYNIPQFTNKLNLNDVLHLIDSVPNVVGLKDSSGLAANIPLLNKAKADKPMAFFIGSDDLLLKALESGADGAISGLAAVCPELILTLYTSFRSGQEEKAMNLQLLVDELIAHIAGFPPPWAIKLALQARGLELGSPSWPLGDHLRLRAQEFQAWFQEWIAKCESSC